MNNQIDLLQGLKECVRIRGFKKRSEIDTLKDSKLSQRKKEIRQIEIREGYLKREYDDLFFEISYLTV